MPGGVGTGAGRGTSFSFLGFEAASVVMGDKEVRIVEYYGARDKPRSCWTVKRSVGRVGH